MDSSALQLIGRKVHGLTRQYEEEQNCKRKTAVTVAFRQLGLRVLEIGHWVNHPLHQDASRCTNETGGCGCVHSEPQAICSLLRGDFHRQPGDLILAVTYSPCTPCAHVIVASRAIERVFWLEDTEHDLRGIDVLKSSLGRAEIIVPCSR